MAAPNSITVAGGTGPKLPPAPKVFDGTPDPEVGRMVQEGAMRYHLDTLDGLAAEDRLAARAVQALRSDSGCRCERVGSATVQTCPVCRRAIGCEP